MPASSQQLNQRGAVRRNSGPQEYMEAVFGARAGRQNSFLARLEENFNMWEAEVDMGGLSLGQDGQEKQEEQGQNDSELGDREVEAPPGPCLLPGEVEGSDWQVGRDLGPGAWGPPHRERSAFTCA